MKPIRATGAVVGVTAVPHFWCSSYAQEEPANDRLKRGARLARASTPTVTQGGQDRQPNRGYRTGLKKPLPLVAGLVAKSHGSDD